MPLIQLWLMQPVMRWIAYYAPLTMLFFFETPINHAGILQCLGLDELVCMLSLVDMS
jgi:hypothetical protein